MAGSRSLQNTASHESNVKNSEIFKTFQRQFLKMLGLKSIPHVKKGTVVPQYMRDLYNNLVEDEHYITSNLAFKDFSTTAGIVRSFYHQDVRDESISNSSKRRVFLDLSSIPSHEELVKAELRVYRNVSGKLEHPKHIISVYQIRQAGVGAQEASVKRILLDSRVVSASTVGWDSYDILKAVQHWRDEPAENHGIEVEIMSANGNLIDISHLRFDKPADLDEKIWPHHRPLAAVYSRDPNRHYHNKRVRRASSRKKSGHKALCKRHDLLVNITKLGWKYVYAPEVYNAYVCKGRCVFPLTANMNSTNHAMVQTLYHYNTKKSRKAVPPACCIPTSLNDFPILFLEQASPNQPSGQMTPKIERFADMVVTGCGCR